ncbi:MAG TPA: creatininase [Candidatus Acidoferrales bacterium]|jgi:creatinine amidohydrolase|nr:creatininase [Candidatus Acidoferrales bacterium]
MSGFEKLHTENVRAEAGKSVLILPVGTVEQHGPHLPLTVDLEIPTRIASKLAEEIHGIVAPAIHYGARSLPQSGGAPTLAGTIFVRGSVLTDYLRDVIAGYVASGFRSIVVVNGHYENEAFIFEALELCRREGQLEGARAVALSWWSLVSDELLRKLFGDKFPGWHAEHASACETSLMLYLRGDLVGETRVDNATPPRAGIYLYPVDPARLSNRGVLGSSSPASAEAGRALFDEICSNLAAVVREQLKP